MTTPMPEAHQRFIAYALIGYLDVVRRTGKGDYNFNYTVGPHRLVEAMRDAGVRPEIIDLFGQIDEVETLIAARGADFDVGPMIRPVLERLSEIAGFEDDPRSAIETLLLGPAASEP